MSKLTVADVSRMTGLSKETIRRGMVTGEIPIGITYKSSKKRGVRPYVNYVVNPKLVEQVFGIDVEKEMVS